MKKIYFASILLGSMQLSFAQANRVMPDMTETLKIHDALQAKNDPEATKYLEGIAKKRKKTYVTKPISYNHTEIPANIRIPGEFEEVQAVCMTWPYGKAKIDQRYDPFDPAPTGAIPLDQSDPQGLIAIKLAHKIQLNNKVIIRIDYPEHEATIRETMRLNGVPFSNVMFYTHKVNGFWERDYGPISYYTGDRDQIGFIDHDYHSTEPSINNVNGERLDDDVVPTVLGNILNYPVQRTKVNIEGGNFMSDGFGTYWRSRYVRDVNISPAANEPQLDNNTFDTLWNESYRPTRPLVELNSLTQCDGGTKHVDIYLKLVDESNILISDYRLATQHGDLNTWNANLTQIQGLRDVHGDPYILHYIPMPTLDNNVQQTSCISRTVNTDRGPYQETSQRTYVNGTTVNGNFVFPIMSNETTPSAGDQAGIDALKAAMPGYNMHPINVATMDFTGGAIHCITMQIPAENPVFIKHKRLEKAPEPDKELPVSATFKNRNGIKNAFVYYRKKGDTNWIAIAMTAGANNEYTANIPATALPANTDIEYFVEATSNAAGTDAEKTISKPIVARNGGFYNLKTKNTLGLSELEMSKHTNFALSIYPNPNHGNFTLPIAIDQARNLVIEVYNNSGQLVYTKTENTQAGLQLKQLAVEGALKQAGQYHVVVKADNEVINTQKIIVNP
jgi:agmatine/peptidylarginine deiminase